MASATTEFRQRMAQVLVANPDRRTRKHKQAVKEVYESTIASLIEKLSEETTRNNELRTRVAQRTRVVADANRDDEPTPSCSICMEDMHGRVTLVCGHEMCPDCFAQHSRVNNTCPFCREELAHANRDDEPTPSCSICMEDMHGRVTLVCGHEMCPDCFAQHSRVNNTCPFCREEFAPKPKKQYKMPLYQIDGIVEMWAESVGGGTPTHPTHSNYFRRQTVLLLDKNDGTLAGRVAVESHIRWLITSNGKILMDKVKEWYDNDIA